MTLNLKHSTANALSPPGDANPWATDLTLAGACVEGDQRAQRRFYDQYYPMVLGICKRYAGPTIEDSDLLSMAFVHAFKQLAKYSGTGSLGGWLRTLTVRSCLTAIRNQTRYEYQEIESSEVEVALPAAAVNKLAMDDLVRMINQLPDMPRVVFNMHTVEGYKHPEIAQQIGISETNSRYHLRQAKLRLRELINRQNMGS